MLTYIYIKKMYIYMYTCIDYTLKIYIYIFFTNSSAFISSALVLLLGRIVDVAPFAALLTSILQFLFVDVVYSLFFIPCCSPSIASFVVVVLRCHSSSFAALLMLQFYSCSFFSLYRAVVC